MQLTEKQKEQACNFAAQLQTACKNKKATCLDEFNTVKSIRIDLLKLKSPQKFNQSAVELYLIAIGIYNDQDRNQQDKPDIKNLVTSLPNFTTYENTLSNLASIYINISSRQNDLPKKIQSIQSEIIDIVLKILFTNDKEEILKSLQQLYKKWRMTYVGGFRHAKNNLDLYSKKASAINVVGSVEGVIEWLEQIKTNNTEQYTTKIINDLRRKIEPLRKQRPDLSQTKHAVMTAFNPSKPEIKLGLDLLSSLKTNAYIEEIDNYFQTLKQFIDEQNSRQTLAPKMRFR